MAEGAARCPAWSRDQGNELQCKRDRGHDGDHEDENAETWISIGNSMAAEELGDYFGIDPLSAGKDLPPRRPKRPGDKSQWN